MKNRCSWVISGDELYEEYHDKEWARAVHEDNKHFELLCLEGAQAGLSWITVLRKREDYRKAFQGFDPQKVALYTERQIDDMMNNRSLIRNRNKLKSCVHNAQAFTRIQKQFGSFNDFVWAYVGHEPIVGNWSFIKDVPTKTELSIKLSNDLKKWGFTFVGPTIIYSYMQAAGLVVDHTKDCFLYMKKN